MEGMGALFFVKSPTPKGGFIFREVGTPEDTVPQPVLRTLAMTLWHAERRLSLLTSLFSLLLRTCTTPIGRNLCQEAAGDRQKMLRFVV